LAAGAGRTFLITEVVAGAVFPLATWVLLPSVGVQASGLSFMAMYVVYLPIIYVVARRRTGFTWTRRVFGQICITVATALAVKLAAAIDPLWGAGLGGICALGSAARAFGSLKSVLLAKVSAISKG
jgi:PST family polysaccharide transporter